MSPPGSSASQSGPPSGTGGAQAPGGSAGPGSATSLTAQPPDVSPVSAATLAQQGMPASPATPSDADQPAAPPATQASATDADKTTSLGANPADKPSDAKPDDTRPLDPQRGSNVVFVLDQSLSMSGKKSAAARRELVKALQDLDLSTNQSFYIYAATNEIRSKGGLQDPSTNRSSYILCVHVSGYQAMPTAGLLQAAPQDIRSATNLILSAGNYYGSDPTSAVQRALEFKPDTVWLLSDGKFSSNVPKAIRMANDSVNARIHTVGFYEPTGEPVLRQIADRNGGTYRFVPPPDPSRPGDEASPGAAPK